MSNKVIALHLRKALANCSVFLDEWDDTPSDFVVRTQSVFLQEDEIPDDIPSQVSGLTILSTAPTPPSPPPADQKRRKSDVRDGRRRSSVRRSRRISGDFKEALETSSFSLKTCKVLYSFRVIVLI